MRNRGKKQLERAYPKRRNSLAPAAIGLILILIVISVYFSRNFLLESKTENSETENWEQQDESLNIEMILPQEISSMIRNKKYQIIDIRSSEDYAHSHIEASNNIPLENIEEKINLLEKNKEIVIVEEFETKEGKEVVSRLEKMGLNAKYLAGGLSEYEERGYSLISYGSLESVKDLAKVSPLTLEEFKKIIEESFGNTILLDVRPRRQYQQDHLNYSVNIPFEELESKKNEIPVKRLIIIDEDPERSFRANAILYDMNIFGVQSLTVSYSELKEELERNHNEEGSENQ